MHLTLYGPYGFTPQCSLKLYSEALERHAPGLYLWATNLPHGYRVSYAGKSDGELGGRLEQEVVRWLAGLDGYLDLQLFLRGERKYIPRPSTGADKLLMDLLDCSLVFLIPVDCDRSTRLTVESALIRRIKSFSSATRDYLANKAVPTKRLVPTQITIAAPPGVQIEGLAQPFQDMLL